MHSGPPAAQRTFPKVLGPLLPCGGGGARVLARLEGSKLVSPDRGAAGRALLPPPLLLAAKLVDPGCGRGGHLLDLSGRGGSGGDGKQQSGAALGQRKQGRSQAASTASQPSG